MVWVDLVWCGTFTGENGSYVFSDFVFEGEEDDADNGVYERSEFGRIAFYDRRQVSGIELGKNGEDLGDGLVARLAMVKETGFAPVLE
jgi:hypothetical protein